MRLQRKNKVAILKYRLVFEELKQAEAELVEGSNNLAGHLSFFREKLSKKKSTQIKNFDEMFFAKPNGPAEIVKSNDTISTGSKSSEQPIWAKKIYKKIVMMTHPDKTSLIKIDSLQEKLNDHYLLAVDSYNCCAYQNLLMIAADLEMDFDQALIASEIVPAIEMCKKRFRNTAIQPGYLWYHVPEENKKETLKQHLQSMGFVFTDDEVEQVIKKVREKSKRKRGARPVNSRRMRLK